MNFLEHLLIINVRVNNSRKGKNLFYQSDEWKETVKLYLTEPSKVGLIEEGFDQKELLEGTLCGEGNDKIVLKKNLRKLHNARRFLKALHV